MASILSSLFTYWEMFSKKSKGISYIAKRTRAVLIESSGFRHLLFVDVLLFILGFRLFLF